MSAFRKTGIYPLDREAIASEFILPSEVFRTVEELEEVPHTGASAKPQAGREVIIKPVCLKLKNSS